MADLGETHGQLDPRESRILRNLFKLEELRVRDVMTPRTVVFSLPATDARLRGAREARRSALLPDPDLRRRPRPHHGVRAEDRRPPHRASGAQRGAAVRLARAVRAVAASASLERVMDEMLDKRDHLLLVLDAYGGLDGVVTLEDVVETLIGIEIVDEADTTVDMRQLARQRWRDRIQRLGIDPALLDEQKVTDLAEGETTDRRTDDGEAPPSGTHLVLGG